MVLSEFMGQIVEERSNLLEELLAGFRQVPDDAAEPEVVEHQPLAGQVFEDVLDEFAVAHRVHEDCREVADTSSANVPTASMCEGCVTVPRPIVRMTWAYSGTSMSARASAARAYAHSFNRPPPPQSQRSGYGMIWCRYVFDWHICSSHRWM